MLSRLHFLFLFFTFSFFNLTAQTVDINAVDGRIYVRTTAISGVDLSNYNNGDPALNALISTYGITEMKLPFGGLTSELDRTFEFIFTDITNVNQLISDLEAFLYIEYAEKKPLYRTSLVPNDVSASQWAFAKIQAFEAWDITTGNSNVKIAIVDNAVSTVHEDLQANIWINTSEIPNNSIDDDFNGYTDDYQGYDVSDGDGNTNPPASSNSGSPFTHGTHCAGIASASTDNGIGIASLGFNSSIIPVKCAPDNSANEGNELPNAYDGVYYAIQADADIISMSFGGTSANLTGQSLMSAASSMGIVLIAAAGNSSTDAPHYPASFPNVISVGSTSSTDMISWFSNYGPTVDVMAPGSGIYSTLSGTGNEYGTKSGTSMACPLVAGLAALVLAENPLFTPAQVEQAIKDGCDPIDMLNPGYEGDLGAGRINAFKTLSPEASISENEEVSFQVYPNPASQSFFIETDTQPENVTLVSLDGRAVHFEMTISKPNVYQIETTQNTGLYLLTMTLEGNSVSKRVLLK